MEIQVAAIGYLGRARRPAPLKEKLFQKLETGNRKPIFLMRGVGPARITALRTPL